MPSTLGFLRDRISNRDSSDALFAAGLKAWNKYEETHKSQYLKQAIRNHQVALKVRGSDHPCRPESLYHNARALWAQCQLSGVTTENSSGVISHYNEALRLLPPIGEAGHRATLYNNLGQIYFSLFRLGEKNQKAFPDSANLNKAIESHQSALKLRSASDDPNRSTSLINLSVALVQKDRKSDLMDAIAYLSEAVELCSAKASSRHLLLLSLDSLANAYHSRYHHSEDTNDVVGKVNALRKILDLMDEEKGRLTTLLNLTKALRGLCELECNPRKDLDEAVCCGREALKLSHNVDKITHVDVLTTLADVLYARCTLSNTEKLTVLYQAIRYYREAINSDPEDSPNPILRSSLAIHIYCQDFEEVDGVTLEDAISYNQDALYTCPKDDRALYLRIEKNLRDIYTDNPKRMSDVL